MPMLITNYRKLARTPLRRDALKIIESAYQAIRIPRLIRERIRVRQGKFYVSDLIHRKKINLLPFSRVFIVGFGKGSVWAVSEIARVFSGKFHKAVALDTMSSAKPSRVARGVKVLLGTHPRPSEKNVKATQYILSLLSGLTQKDLVIFFVGGGGSSLLCSSREEMAHSSVVFNELTRGGASIKELNTVRKHLSLIKGGRLARHIFPAHSVSLIVSDVCGNDFSMIASGPTIIDKTTVADAKKILKEYLRPAAHRSVLIRNLRETPKDKKYFRAATHMLLACNEDAILAMTAEARKLGYRAKIISLTVDEESQKLFPPLMRKIGKKEAYTFAGETKVRLRNKKGKGGRNQEAVLAALCEMMKWKRDEGVVVCSVASDGFDNTLVAGAMADELDARYARNKKIDPIKFLSRNNSYPFFQKTGGAIKVKRESFNVADLMLILKG